MPSNINEIHESFARQAETFEVTHMNVSRKKHMEHMIELLSPLNEDSILEVAAGTCACGRALAGTAAAVTCLDTTPQMLAIGNRESQKSGLANIVFVLGDALAMPFLNESYDMTLCRLAFHHIPEYKKAFSEMVRVLRPGGRLVLVDLIAEEGALFQTKEDLEIARDPSHARSLTKKEMLDLFDNAHLTVTHTDQTDLPVSMEDWLDVTKPAPEVQDDIRKKMRADLDGGPKTGFGPYEKDGQICFDQHWFTIIGKKEA